MLDTKILDKKEQIDNLVNEIEQECTKLFEQIIQKSGISKTENKKLFSQLSSKIKENRFFNVKKIL